MLPEDTADKIDSEPILVLGCNSGEILNLAIFGFVVGLFIGTIVSIAFWIGFLVLPFLFIGPMLSIYFGGKYLGKAKEGKPDGYFHRLMFSQLSEMGIGQYFITRYGCWRNTR
jgi:conjugative transfer region protein (TIGR03750 family)